MSEPRVNDETLHLAYAEAAILLIESLMLHLVERGILSTGDLVEFMEAAVETKRDMMKEGIHPHIAEIAKGVLTSISNSVGASRPSTQS